MGHSEIELINHLIDQKEKDIKKYLLKENASQYIVDKMNRELSELIMVYNKLIDLESGLSIQVLKKISENIAKIEQVDPELNGHTIYIHKSEGKNHSRIYIKGR